MAGKLMSFVDYIINLNTITYSHNAMFAVTAIVK